MADDMQRLREALAEVMRGPGRVADHADAILVLLAEEGWVAPEADGTSRSAAGRSTPVEEPLATPPFKGQLQGHGLRMEGRVSGFHGWGSGPGKARCYCGEESPSLPTTAARQRWHREHKAQIAAARQEADRG